MFEAESQHVGKQHHQRQGPPPGAEIERQRSQQGRGQEHQEMGDLVGGNAEDTAGKVGVGLDIAEAQPGHQAQVRQENHDLQDTDEHAHGLPPPVLPLERGEIALGLDLVDDGRHHFIHLAPDAVVGLADEVHSVLPEELAGCGALSLTGRVVHRDGIAAEHLDDLHAGDVGGPVAEVDHMAEGDGFLVFLLALVDARVVADIHDALGDLEEELRLGGVVHGHSRPDGHAAFVVPERAGENLLELFGDGGAFDELGLPRRIDVVLHLHAVAPAVFVDQGKPLAYAGIEFDALAEGDEGFAGEGDALGTGLVDHQLHIGEDAAHLLPFGHRVALAPELLGRLPDGLDEAELLHVARRERSVEIVDQRYNGSFLHRPQRYFFFGFFVYL